MSRWTDKQIEQVKALWASGETSPAIAEKMGLTKNQVIGKLRVLGLLGKRRGVQVVKRVEPPKITLPHLKFMDRT